MKLFLAVFALSLLFLSGCSSGSADTAMDGESIYKKSCAACHGENLQGGMGPILVNIKSKVAEADIQSIISKGSTNMPGKLLNEEESKIVTKWLLTK